MTLDDIAESIGTTTDEQISDDNDRLADTSVADDIHQRSMDDYDGGWDADH